MENHWVLGKIDKNSGFLYGGRIGKVR